MNNGKGHIVRGFILLSRAILDKSLWSAPPDMLRLFIYLLLKARHNRKPKRYPNFEIKRGELLTSLAEIVAENEWVENKAVRRWSRQKVSRMLAKLVSDTRIKLIADTYGTHIRIVNYETYQDPETYKADTAKASTSDNSGTTPDNSGTTAGINKNGNNGKNEDNSETQTSEIPPQVQSIFDHWNTYRGRTVEKHNRESATPVTVRWQGHRELSQDKRDAIKQALRRYSVDDAKAAIDNYATVLLGPEYWWTYAWALNEFFTVGEEKHKAAQRKWWRWLPDNFRAEKYRRQAAPGEVVWNERNADEAVAEQFANGPVLFDEARFNQERELVGLPRLTDEELAMLPHDEAGRIVFTREMYDETQREREALQHVG